MAVSLWLAWATPGTEGLSKSTHAGSRRASLLRVSFGVLMPPRRLGQASAAEALQPSRQTPSQAAPAPLQASASHPQPRAWQTNASLRMPGRSHIVEIDYLRGVAILLTGLAHINAATVEPIPALSWLYRHAEFWGGVYLFFVISGYVITRGFGASLSGEKGESFTGAWRDFYRRRFFRIVPLALSAIAITLLLSMVFNHYGSYGGTLRNLVQALLAATFAYNLYMPIWTPTFSVFWSLALEEQFYLLFPALCRVPLRVRVALLLLPIVALAFAHRPAGSVLVFLPVDALCWGVLIALAERAGWTTALEPTWLRNRGMRNAATAISLLALVLIPAWLKALTPATSLMAVVCAWIVFCASFDKGYSRGAIPEWVRLVGIVSFSAYLLHMPAFLAAREVGLSLAPVLGPSAANVAAVVVALSLASLFTVVAYRYIELPMRLRGKASPSGSLSPAAIEADAMR